MADNVTLNSMSGGAVVATDEVTDGSLGTVQVQYVKIMDGTLNGTTKAGVGAAGLSVIERGTTIASTSASVTTSSGQIVAASSTRRTIVLTNLGSDYVWIGASGVTDNEGIRLAPGQALTIDKSPTAAVHAKAASGTQTVAVFTEGD
jgi:hypothetical protein